MTGCGYCAFINGIDVSEDSVPTQNTTVVEKVFSILNGVVSPVAETMRSGASDRPMWGFVSLAAEVLGYSLMFIRTQTKPAASDCILLLLFLVVKTLVDLRLLPLPEFGAWPSLAWKRGLERRRASGPEAPVPSLEAVAIDGQGSPQGISLGVSLGLTSPEKRTTYTADRSRPKTSPTAMPQPCPPPLKIAWQSPRAGGLGAMKAGRE